jgi:Uma2 family endonuclease
MSEDKIYELVDGKLVRRDMSVVSSWVGGELLRRLGAYVDEDKLGWVWPSDLGYACFPDAPGKVRRADVSFIRAGRLTRGLTADEGYCEIAPDLAVEVVSPKEKVNKLDQKIVEYLDAGVPLVWVINPGTRRAHVYRHDGSVTLIREEEELSGEDVIPGFRCRLASILPEKPVEQAAPG